MPAPRKYPDEVRERAVRMVFEIREESGQQQGAIARVADRLGVNRETLRGWVRQAEVDGGEASGCVECGRAADRRVGAGEPGTAPGQRNPEGASAFFARELDPRLPK
jgi:transposase